MKLLFELFGLLLNFISTQLQIDAVLNWSEGYLYIGFKLA